jgi:hypothetical protein
LFALYYEDAHEFISVYDTRHQAVIIAAEMSRGQKRVVIGIDNSVLGSTEICCRFVDGKEIERPGRDCCSR